MYKIWNENKYITQIHTTTTEIQTPDLRQTHKECGGVQYIPTIGTCWKQGNAKERMEIWNACTYMNINRTNTYISINFLFIIPTSCFRFVHICYHKRLQTSLKEVLVTQFLYLFDTCITINVNMHCESTGRYIIVTKYTVIQRKNMYTNETPLRLELVLPKVINEKSIQRQRCCII